jgi:tetratricopeptide (TPR) repeat protein
MVVLVAACATMAAGCSQVERFQAYMHMRDAHTAYAQQNYRGAAEAYEQAIVNRELTDSDPRLTPAYFYLANSYDNMYRPTRRGEPANDELLTKAVEFYRKSAEVEQEPLIKRRALQYLYSAYGPEKLNDPSQSEPIVQQLIQMDPNDTTNYTALARLYEDSGDYERAEATLKQAIQVAPDSPDVYTSIAGFYERQDNFEAMIEALQTRASKDANNPEAYYTLAVQYWNKAYRDFRLTDAQKADYVATGVQHIDKALSINKDYQDALVYKGLLLRLQANLSRNPAEQQRLLREAQTYSDRAEELRKARAAAPAGE